MTYEQMLAELFSSRRFGVKLGLDRMDRALGHIGHPERRMGHVVHIGGTNGKGSTAAMVEAMLRCAGFRTGLFTSPHLSRFTERIRVGGQEVAREDLAMRYAMLQNGADLTFFERATLLALESFAEEKTDVVVLEVGMGGSLDATNAVVADVAAVTGVSLDHEEILGKTVEAIAIEKAGIYKCGKAAVIGQCGASELLASEAKRRGVKRVVVVGRDVPNRPPQGWSVGLLGAHQERNAATALAAIAMLGEATGLEVGDRERRAGLAGVRWPGRLEELELGGHRLYLDGAHNPEAATVLAEALRLLSDTSIVAIIGISADKNVAATVAPVVALAEVVIATEAPSPRALNAERLGEIVRALSGPANRQVFVVRDCKNAIAVAGEVLSRGAIAVAGEVLSRGAIAVAGEVLSRGTAGRTVESPKRCAVVFGSLFLVGAIRAYVKGESANHIDPVCVQEPPIGLFAKGRLP